MPVHAGTTSLSALEYWRCEQLNSADLTFERATISHLNNIELSIIPNDSCLDNRKPNKPLVYFKTSSYFHSTRSCSYIYFILFHFISFHFYLFIYFTSLSFTHKIKIQRKFLLTFCIQLWISKIKVNPYANDAGVP